MTRDEVLARVRYDPVTGLFERLPLIGRGFNKPGPIPVVLNHAGYPMVRLNGRAFLAHRLAWLIMTSEDRDPALPLDHINGDRSDNRWVNLRAATPALNTKNRGRGKNNSSGVVGVCLQSSGGPWKARLSEGGRQHFSLHLCFGKAVQARRAMEAEHSFIGSRRLAYSGDTH